MSAEFQPHRPLYGHFDDAHKAYVVTDPVTPRPWLNYLGNGCLAAFISQNSGGLLWLHEPATRRITRYHSLAAPGDRPGFYLYVRDRKTGTVWNPHFAPTCIDLDAYECRHSPGVTVFSSRKDGIQVTLTLGVAPERDVLLWYVRVLNTGTARATLQLSSYMEFGLLEFMREALGWCYLKNHFSLHFDPKLNAIRYDYHVFEAPSTPAMLFGCTETVSHFDCSREAFTGRTGSLENPEVLRHERELTDSDLPGGGHACAALAVDLTLDPGGEREFGYTFAVADSWHEAESSLRAFSTVESVRQGLEEVSSSWAGKLGVFQVASEDATFNRFVNIWNPYNAVIALEHCRIISTDHAGTDGLRFRDTSQDCLAVVSLDTSLAMSKLSQVLAQQTRDGGGCFAFYPHTTRPASDVPHRSDNPVWPVYTAKALIEETGRLDFLLEVIPFRDGGEATVFEHLRRGVEHVALRRGPHGLPLMFHADWNDGLALFGDENAESVMLGMQLVAACRDLREIAIWQGVPEVSEWCSALIKELLPVLNSDACWDGQWYRRLLLSNGKVVGSAANRQGQIYLDVQPWAVLSGVGDFEGRGRLAMEHVQRRLGTEWGLAIVAPCYTGFPEPEDKPLGSNPGTNENGGIFCHANTWAIIAECLLGNGDRAYRYFRNLVPERASAKVGADAYEREPYVSVSTMLGPGSSHPGRGGISWLTGTSSWLYRASTQYILGIRPVFEGLLIRPCLPRDIPRVRVVRQFRGVEYVIVIEQGTSGEPGVFVDGRRVPDGILRPSGASAVEVLCRC